jgi:hypothetical protein
MHERPVGHREELVDDEVFGVGAQPVTEPVEDVAATGPHLRVDDALLQPVQPRGPGSRGVRQATTLGRRRADGPVRHGHHLGR